MKELPWMLNYVDSMMVVDKNLQVLYTVRINGWSESEPIVNDYSAYSNMYYFDVYPQLDPQESTMKTCLKTGKVIYQKNQTFKDFRGRIYHTNNITFPIIRFGEIVGAIELSQDRTSLDDLQRSSERTKPRDPSRTNLHAYDHHITFDDIITQNSELLDTIERAKLYAKLDSPVLLYGETGTGKELFASAMVNHNPDRKGPFITHNCAATPENLFESILFGSTKGAFTGAEDKKGLFELADGGTLFLDELNSMPIHLQPKLLRILQDGMVRPLGSTKETQLEVKVIVAMNKNPLELMREGKLREDLFYRLSSNTLYLPPLRERKEDIYVYVEHFLKQARQRGAGAQRLSPALMDLFLHYSWHGNVRELKHVVEAMTTITSDRILQTKHLPAYFKEAVNSLQNQESSQDLESYTKRPIQMSLRKHLEKVEREMILRALTHSRGNIVKAAEILELPRQTLTYRMNKLDITP